MIKVIDDTPLFPADPEREIRRRIGRELREAMADVLKEPLTPEMRELLRRIDILERGGTDEGTPHGTNEQDA
jgi:hypothetical protein